jgi:hypothetical protein
MEATQPVEVLDIDAGGTKQWSLDPKDAFPTLTNCVYSGTTMLNRVLQRQGANVGLIVNLEWKTSRRCERCNPSRLLGRPVTANDPTLSPGSLWSARAAGLDERRGGDPALARRHVALRLCVVVGARNH